MIDDKNCKYGIKYQKMKLILKRDSNYDKYLNVKDKLDLWLNHKAKYTGRESKYKEHRTGIIEALNDFLDKIIKENLDLDTQINDITRTNGLSE